MATRTHAIAATTRSRPAFDAGAVRGAPARATVAATALLTASDVMMLQRRVGNRATRSLLEPDTPPPHPVIQRWGGKEHKDLGDEGSGGRVYKMGGKLHLSHGDIVMLSGDYFDPRDTLPDGKKNAESLFKLAGTPSSDPGKQVGTQDEVVYALYDNLKNKKDPRFAPGGVFEWATKDKAFSDAVKKRVDDRYLRLASENVEHFSSPKGVAAPPTSGMRTSAAGSYREMHEAAIILAFTNGQNGRPVDDALAREAAAQHFLTDAFSGGHVRTPRVLINDYWNAKYPAFWDNLRKKIALDVARYINANTTNLATTIGTVSMINDSVLAEMMTKTAAMPPLGFGDLVGRVVHDLDNEVGVHVINDVGTSWQAKGDGELDKDPATKAEAKTAVRLGNADVTNAHVLGKSKPGPYADAWILNTVKAQAAAPANAGAKYAPEQVVPRVDPTTEKSTQAWQAPSYADLWKVPVRSDLPAQTFGVEIKKSLESGEIGSQLKGTAALFPASQGGFGTTVHPRAAFLKGFLEPLKKDPLTGLRGIIDFDPSAGQAHFNVDDAAMEELAGMTDEQLKQLTLNQRAARVKAIVEGTFSFTSGDEGEQVIKVFATAPAGDRAKLYELVEGHAWKGDWKHGVWTDDDEIWNALSSGQLTRLRLLINGGSTATTKTGNTMQELQALTTTQRATKIKTLIGGFTTSSTEGERVILLFRTARPGDRKEIYRLVEGHTWTGDWIEGWLTSDDDLWNALTSGQLTRLKALINQ